MEMYGGVELKIKTQATGIKVKYKPHLVKGV